ncbi:STM3941 family protein [uncultured Kordia sp.]|uniref:STM3941 family protein n=1 Tax=uncultured Kordia sp. TaxID=507699 RepID=UPI00261C222C|nr:STM3941 family protein [uncultured Kordia sp.]
MNNPIEIPQSKKKIILLILGSLVFVVLGACLYFEIIPNNDRMNASFIKIVGIVSMVFFGLTLAIGIKRIVHTKLGLIINEKGIMDNSTATSVGFIPWRDITGVQPIKVASTNFLIIHVKNPQNYIDKGKNMLVKQSLKYNLNNHGSPIAIGSTTLSMKFNTIGKLVNEAFEKRTS